MIKFEVSGLEIDNPTNALSHYEIKFSQDVNADWLISVIRNALILEDMGKDIQDLVKENATNVRAEFRIMSR